MVKTVEKVWGTELWIANGPLYCGKLLTLRKGFHCSLHRHPVKDETFYLRSGKVFFELGGKVVVMSPGQSVHVPPGTWHRFTGLEDSEIFEVSTQHSDDDVERMEPSGPR